MDAYIDLSYTISPQAGDYENAEKHSMQLWRQVNYLSLLPPHVSQSSQHDHYDQWMIFDICRILQILGFSCY